MLKLFTKKRALIISKETQILAGLSDDNIDETIKTICDERVEYVSSIHQADFCILPYVLKSTNDEIFDAFYKLSTKHNKTLMCFSDVKFTDTMPNLHVMYHNHSIESEHNLLDTIKTLNDLKKTIEHLRWDIINVYKCHIPGKNNNFINDEYDIDSYCFFKKMLASAHKSKSISLTNDKPSIVFSSVYGLQKPTDKSAMKIFYNGESKQRYAYYANVDMILKSYDYFIGFDVPTNNRMFRLPYWMTMFDFYKGKASKCLNILSDKTRFNIEEKKLGCVMIATTDFNSLRSSFVFKCFENGIKVLCPSKICNNTQPMQVGREGDKGVHFFHGKMDYLKKFKIEICFENTNEYGYVTEKIFGALMTGCIPVYWGSSFEGLIEGDIINMDRVLYLMQDLSNLEQILQQIHKLVTDEQYYETFFNKPIFKENAKDILINHLNNFQLFLMACDRVI